MDRGPERLTDLTEPPMAGYGCRGFLSILSISTTRSTDPFKTRMLGC